MTKRSATQQASAQGAPDGQATLTTDTAASGGAADGADTGDNGADPRADGDGGPDGLAVATVEAAVLTDCQFGKVGTVVELEEAHAKAGAEFGVLDLHPDAIAALKAK